MPIRFHCKRCHQLLGIATRKAGSVVECPKCGISQVVPSEEAAAAAMAMDHFAKTHETVETPADLVVYDDQPSAIETPPAPTAEKVAAATSEPTPPSKPPARTALQEPGEPVPGGMILFPRRSFYVQGVLLLVLAAVFFGAGYLIGRGDANYHQQAEEEAAAKERILVEGRVAYSPSSEQLVGDQGAVIIALPDGEYPEKTMLIQGIRPQDPPPGENQKTVRTIADLGGVYTRADASGAFSLVVPDQGKYHLLVISAHAARPDGSLIDEFDLSEMEQYFKLAEHLVNRFKYRWTTEEIHIGFNPIEIEFGLDRRP
ncbi:MAG: hypothetical protein JXB62_22720 [Pirellulales bacterium]|nr:hypothetical protein [Pirellulales bacterium]